MKWTHKNIHRYSFMAEKQTDRRPPLCLLSNKTFVYALMEICLQWSKRLGPYCSAPNALQTFEKSSFLIIDQKYQIVSIKKSMKFPKNVAQFVLHGIWFQSGLKYIIFLFFAKNPDLTNHKRTPVNLRVIIFSVSHSCFIISTPTNFVSFWEFLFLETFFLNLFFSRVTQKTATFVDISSVHVSSFST